MPTEPSAARLLELTGELNDIRDRTIAAIGKAPTEWVPSMRRLIGAFDAEIASLRALANQEKTNG